MTRIATASRLSTAPQARPFLKWAGGKTQLLPQIFARFPTNFRRYHEPFIGGGAVFFSLQPYVGILSDINEDLVATYQAIKNNVEGVIRALQKHRTDADYYYAVRAQHDAHLGTVRGAARTIFLNRTCFNGLYRVNRKGQFNVPYGRYANPTICNAENLRNVSAALADADIRQSSVFNIGRRVRRGDLVYFDPPYDPVSASSSFTSYARLAFGREEQARLAAFFRRLANRGVHVVLSNSDTPFIRDLYRGFRIDRVYARRAINSRADRRGRVGEVIVSVG